MLYASEDIPNVCGKQKLERCLDQYFEEEEVVDFGLLKRYVEENGATVKVGHDTLSDALKNVAKTLKAEYIGDEFAPDLTKYLKKVFFINSACTAQLGESFIKVCVNTERAKNTGGKDLFNIFTLLNGVENYKEHFENRTDKRALL